mgnify:CR=1 FL=1
MSDVPQVDQHAAIVVNSQHAKLLQPRQLPQKGISHATAINLQVLQLRQLQQFFCITVAPVVQFEAGKAGQFEAGKAGQFEAGKAGRWLPAKLGIGKKQKTAVTHTNRPSVRFFCTSTKSQAAERPQHIAAAAQPQACMCLCPNIEGHERKCTMHVYRPYLTCSRCSFFLS